MMTLTDCQEHGVGVFLWCNACAHSAVLDAAELAVRLGSSYPVPLIARKARCSACGSRNEITTRPDWRGPGVITNHGPPTSG